MSEFKSEYVNNLPDAYRKDAESNNYKILNIAQKIIGKLNSDIDDVYSSLDLEQATGKTLDLYGESVGQARGLATDDQYRVMIKSKIMRNIMNGDYNSLLSAACLMFGCKYNEFHVAESEKPATVDVISLPFNVLNHIGLSAEQTVELIKVLVPVGVAVDSVSLDGSFEFGTIDSEYDENKGFAISEQDQSLGGYLGFLSSSQNEKPLPI